MPRRQAFPTSVGPPLSQAAKRSAIAWRENWPVATRARATHRDISVSSVIPPGRSRSQPPPTRSRWTPCLARISAAVRNSTLAPSASPVARPRKAPRARRWRSRRSMGGNVAPGEPPGHAVRGVHVTTLAARGRLGNDASGEGRARVGGGGGEPAPALPEYVHGRGHVAWRGPTRLRARRRSLGRG